MCVCVWVCVPRYQFQSCSNCEVQHSYSPTTTANHQFCVWPCRGAAYRLWISICTGCCQQTAAPGPATQPQCNKTHIACNVPYLAPQTIPMRPLERRGRLGAKENKTSTPGWEHQALDGRKIFIDHVTKPTYYEPPGFKPAPPPPRASGCVCGGGGRTILERETRMGPGPPWSPEAPPKSVQRTLRAPPCLAPTGVAAGGLAWARTSGGVGLCDLRPCASMLGRVMLLHPCPLRGGRGAPVLS